MKKLTKNNFQQLVEKIAAQNLPRNEQVEQIISLIDKDFCIKKMLKMYSNMLKNKLLTNLNNN